MRTRLSPAHIGRWSARRPWLAIGMWLLFVVACVAVGTATGTKTLSNGAVGESARGYSIMDRQGLWGAPRELAYIHSATLRSDSPAFAAAARDLERRFTALAVPVSHRVSRDRHSEIVVATLNGSALVTRLREIVAAAQRAHPRLMIEETGDISANQARDQIVNGDLHRVELVAIPVTLIVLFLAFGSLVAALVPVLLGLTAVAAGMGLLGPLSQVFPVQDSAKTVILLIGLAVGVDYALFYVIRSRQERRGGAAPAEALGTTSRTSGRTVIISGATVTVAMAGMFIAGANVLNGIAAGTIAVIACAVGGSITVLPAVLALLGPNIDRGRIPHAPQLGHGRRAQLLPAVLTRVLDRPLVATAAAVTVLLALAYPALSLRIAKPSDLALAATTTPALSAYADVQRAFPGAGQPAIVVTQIPTSSRKAAATAIAHLGELAVQTGIAHRPISVTTNRTHTAAAISLPLEGNGANAASRDAVEQLRRTIVPETLGKVAGANTAVTGSTAEDTDFTTQIDTTLPYVIAFVLSLSFMLLLTAFRSLIIPLKAVTLNLLSVAASYGVLALVFEHHWAEPILGFHSNGTVVAWLPLFLFVVLFGLSMDYHVFILSRVRENVDQGQSTSDAIRNSITTTAPVVTAAALVMVAVFSLFGTLSSLDLKQAGVGLATAVLLDATIIRGVLLPASMTLLGERNWYLPARLAWIPRTTLETQIHPDQPSTTPAPVTD
ncbi:MAG: MMPL family transporter [Solirubrobacterales bacterium]